MGHPCDRSFYFLFCGPLFGVQTLGYSILAAALVLSVMIIPFILNILIEIFRTIPIELKEASLSLGATQWQTVKSVLVKKAFQVSLRLSDSGWHAHSGKQWLC